MRRNAAGRSPRWYGLRAAATLVLALLAVNCSDSTGPPEELAGTYGLMTVDGKSLPIVQDDTDDHRTELTAGQLILHVDTTYQLQLRGRVIRKAEGTTEYYDEGASGRFALNRNHITLTVSTSRTLEGTVSGSTVTVLLGDNHRYAFRRDQR